MSCDHPLSVDTAMFRLVDDTNLRSRLAFEFGDEDVIVQARDLTYLTRIPNHPFPVRVFQNNKLKWVNTDTIIKTRYAFSSGKDHARVKSERRITATSANTSRSQLRTTIVDQNSESFSKAVIIFLTRRQIRENELLNNDDRTPFPYETALEQIKTSLNKIDDILEAEAALDPSVIEAIAEIRALKSEIEVSTESFGEALREREAAREELDNATRRLEQAGEILAGMVPEPEIVEGGNLEGIFNFVVAMSPFVIVSCAWLWKRIWRN
jgi:hypothetical protein